MVPTTFDAQPLTRDLVLINIHNERAEHLWRMPIAVHLKSCKAEWSRPFFPSIVSAVGVKLQMDWVLENGPHGLASLGIGELRVCSRFSERQVA